MNRFMEVAHNATTLRSELLRKLLDPRRDIDDECGYPKTISPDQYKVLYDREGVARRVVQVIPQESWKLDPVIYESEDADETEFEKAWNQLVEKHNILYHLYHVDELSGVGRFGVLLLGFPGEDLSLPVPGVDLLTGEIDDQNTEVEDGNPDNLLYLRAFDEACVTVDEREGNKQSPRFGRPTRYTIKIREDQYPVGGGANIIKEESLRVHWTRVIHVADGCTTSMIYGTPRMQPVYNRIYDIRKILSGSGEMFWRGAFPGIAIETSGDTDTEELDTDSVKEQMELYMNGLQRYLALTGVTAKSLTPQIADPSAHVTAQLEMIAITLGIPKRIFFGSEEAKLASAQDARTWNDRVRKRQSTYLTPMLVRPFVDRLIAAGVLPTPAQRYTVFWPDLDTVTNMEKADVAVKRTQALAQYVSGDVDQIVPPEEYMTIVLEMDPEEVKQIVDAAVDYQNVRDEKRQHDAEIQSDVNKTLAESQPQEDTASAGE